MQSTKNLARMDFTRQELLWVWMRRKKLKYSDVARALEVTPGTVRAWFEAESIPSWRHDHLIKYGIPEELLPPAENIAPGPKKTAS